MVSAGLAAFAMFAIVNEAKIKTQMVLRKRDENFIYELNKE